MFVQIVINLQKNFQYIYWKKIMYKWTDRVQTCVVQGSTVILGKHVTQLVGAEVHRYAVERATCRLNHPTSLGQ